MLNLSHKMMQTTSITIGRKEIWILYTRWQESYVIKRAEAQTNTPFFMRSNKNRCIKGPSCSVSYPPRKSLTYSWEMRIRHKQSVDYPSQRHLSTFPRLNPENPSVEGSCCLFIDLTSMNIYLQWPNLCCGLLDLQNNPLARSALAVCWRM